MLSKLLTTGLLAVHLAAGVANGFNITEARCGNEDPPVEALEVANLFANGTWADDFETDDARRKPIRVRTHVHIVTSPAARNRYPGKKIKKQMAVLNKNYRPYKVSFKLASVSRTVNRKWARASPYSGTNFAMKKRLHRGRYDELNLYFLSGLTSSTRLLGQCEFPVRNIGKAPKQRIRDGCTIDANTMPGGNAAPFNKGKTTTHEVGHWFALFHVFQGNSCRGPGDYVRDTPQQRSASSGCPRNKDSCPGGGKDAIHNYMDYSNDACYNRFSPGQGARIRAAWNQLRKGR